MNNEGEMLQCEVKQRLLIEDEYAIIKTAIKKTRRCNVILDKHNASKKVAKYSRILVISDGSRAGVLASEVFEQISAEKYPLGCTVLNAANDSVGAFPKDCLNNDTAVFVFIDSERCKYRERILNLIKEAFTSAKGFKNVRFVVHIFVPEPKGVPEGVSAVAEREYDYILEKKEEMRSPSGCYVLDLHRFCREAVRDNGLNLTVLRSVNMFGILADNTFSTEFFKVAEESFKIKKVEITDEDHSTIVDITTVTDTVCAAYWALYNAVPGHEFNVVSHRVSKAMLKRIIFEGFSNCLSLTDNCSPKKSIEHRSLNSLKFNGTNWKLQECELPLSDTVKKIVCYQVCLPFSYDSNTAIYEGRLTQLKSAEMLILREIDQICRKHGINYFLAGGTLLGAVRNGKSIPWDDDYDIGFLRPEFDKFRKVCDEELGDRFVHTCYYNGTKSHYMVDKIRLRDTYFSTKYSSIHAVDDGVFIDCLVYDATFKNKLLAKIHDKLSAKCGYLVQAYWQELRRDELRLHQWLILKLLEFLFPIRVYHSIYSWVISWKKNEKSPTHVIDSVGKLIGQGTMPFGGLEGVKRIPFEDNFMAPIPENPKNYLVYAYGDGYMQPPPYCKRQAPHNFARIDLGKYLFAGDYDVDFRNVDLRGELFENDASM